MSIFKRKTKGEKGITEKSKKEGKDDGKKQAATEKPAQQPYRPKHAASDAVHKPTATNGSHLSKDAADYAQRNANLQYPLAHHGNHPFAQAGARNTPVSHSLPPYRGLNGGLDTMQRNNSAEVFTTDPDAPPMPKSSAQGSSNAAQPNGAARLNSGYFSQQQTIAPSFDSPMLGNPKMAVAARDRGYTNPHMSSDSGYGSTSHSRAPSEQMNLQEQSKPHLPRDSSGFLPELSLSEELAREPAFSEASYGGDESTEKPATMPKQPEGVLKNSKGYSPQLDPSNDGRSVKSSKSHGTAQKQARFEHAPEPVSSGRQQELLQPQQSASSQHSQSLYLPEPIRDERPESATLPPSQFSLPDRTKAAQTATYEEPTPSFSVPARHSMPPPQRLPEPQPQYTLPARLSTPPPARDREQVAPPVRLSTPGPQQPSFAPLERIVSPSLRSAEPPVGSLDGFKVNKRGKILDEEGEIIGELIDGDIMDCVRQRCNAYGEVLDDYGRVVGRVQPLEHSLDSSIMRLGSPGPSPAPVVQQHNYFAPQIQQQPQRAPAPPTQRQSRRESQPGAFTPAWQRQSHNNQDGLAWELRDHLANAQAPSYQPIQPADFPGNVTAVELDAGGRRSEEEEYEEEEMLPIFDHSEVFMPVPSVPSVPPRSSKRSETPSPPAERQWAASLLIRPSSPSPAQRAVEDAKPAPSRHTSAPPVPRQPQAQDQPWAMAAQNTLTTALAIGPESQQQAPRVSKPTSAAAPAVPQASTPACVPAPQAEVQQRQPDATQVPEQQQTRRSVLRSTSDSSMSDLARSYARPSMSPVPEDGDAPNNAVSQERSPALFSYKGDIPASDGPQSNVKLAPPRILGAKSPPLSSFPRQALTGGLPGGSPFAPMNSAQFSSAGGLSARATPPRQFTTGVPSPRQVPSFQGKSSLNAPLKRSPLSGHETTPPESDQGSNDGDRNIGVANGMHSRQPSLRSMRSMQSTPTTGKARTYFTHAGRVVIGDGEPPPSHGVAAEKQPVKEAAPSISGVSTASKKKSRFSLGFGKNGQAVAAH